MFGYLFQLWILSENMGHYKTLQLCFWIKSSCSPSLINIKTVFFKEQKRYTLLCVTSDTPHSYVTSQDKRILSKLNILWPTEAHRATLQVIRSKSFPDTCLKNWPYIKAKRTKCFLLGTQVFVVDFGKIKRFSTIHYFSHRFLVSSGSKSVL